MNTKVIPKNITNTNIREIREIIKYANINKNNLVDIMELISRRVEECEDICKISDLIADDYSTMYLNLNKLTKCNDLKITYSKYAKNGIELKPIDIDKNIINNIVELVCKLYGLDVKMCNKIIPYENKVYELFIQNEHISSNIHNLFDIMYNELDNQYKKDIDYKTMSTIGYWYMFLKTYIVLNSEYHGLLYKQ